MGKTSRQTDLWATEVFTPEKHRKFLSGKKDKRTYQLAKQLLQHHRAGVRSSKGQPVKHGKISPTQQRSNSPDGEPPLPAAPRPKRGIQRKKRGQGFVYLNRQGKVIREGATLERIKALVIPPAWEDVWISPSPTARLQVTGRDARGRKQYLYHPAWRAVQERQKYRRILRFAKVLPHVRRRVRRDLQEKGLGLKKVLATVVSLLDCSLIRVGNPEYARENGSFGLTTLRDQHVSLSSTDLDFRFRGKSQKFHTIRVCDEKLAKIVKQCRAIQGPHLFQYRDEQGKPHKVTSADVNEYLREISGEEFSAKDFRTWSATVIMIGALMKIGACTSLALTKRNLKAGLGTVAERLGNTPAVCRKSYIHPIVLKTYLTRHKLPRIVTVKSAPKGLLKAEAIAYEMLQRLLRGPKKSLSAG